MQYQFMFDIKFVNQICCTSLNIFVNQKIFCNDNDIQVISNRNIFSCILMTYRCSANRNIYFSPQSYIGGPLGELVQWSDLISTLYILGHDIEVTSEMDQLGRILAKLPSANSPCQSRSDLPVQIIYTDIVGLGQFKKQVKNGYAKFR